MNEDTPDTNTKNATVTATADCKAPRPIEDRIQNPSIGKHKDWGLRQTSRKITSEVRALKKPSNSAPQTTPIIIKAPHSKPSANKITATENN